MAITNATLESSISWAFPYYMFTNINGTEVVFSHFLNASNETSGSFDTVDDDLAYTLRYGVLGSVLLR